ncbi:hypothetical protein GOP47_0024054 [Adiantum capillus-veneris]|nr:hypothetical protein GOP47_0024054 [Adiantum capillus-veneris]
MASCRLMHALGLALLTLLFATVAASSNESPCTNQQPRCEQWRQQLRSCNDYMRQHQKNGPEEAAPGCSSMQQAGDNPRDQPSQQCCQSLQRISSQDRCRALREVYGGRMQETYGFDGMQAGVEEKASRLLQRCNLSPGECGYQDLIVNEVDRVQVVKSARALHNVSKQ